MAKKTAKPKKVAKKGQIFKFDTTPDEALKKMLNTPIKKRKK